jgi:NADH-quinone oxidoreductase subunit A
MASYVPLLIMLIVTAVVSGGMVVGSMFLGPKKPSAYKSDSYECGMTPVGNARERFPIKFYLVAMLFIIFDIETIFLYPWAVTFHGLPHAVKIFEFSEMGVFVAILFVGYFYIIGKGALDWDESESASNQDRMSPEVRAPRPTLRYGNENSGPVNLEGVPLGVRTPSYGASSQEEYGRATVEAKFDAAPSRRN